MAKRILLTCVFAASVALAPNALVSAGEPSAAARAAIRIDNFGAINSNYYRGAQPEGGDYAQLAALGVKMVIDLQKDGKDNERQLVERAGMKFVRIPMTTHVPPTKAQQEQFLALVNDPENQPVYVHCKGGKHRTGVMTALYRMENEGWTSDRAFREMKNYKFGADFLHSEFKRFVYSYRPEVKNAGNAGAPAAAPAAAPGSVLAPAAALD